ncbi:Oxidation resistance protein 1 [Amphibalanus amphitrite]|uniref:Oxidation resistance protein 1 n=1 Tax=Amphibalanus amphitrite TaxID=1232801 RepID=A0A6A4W5K4_AMPAM|nr:Oxidation resistance protein 1 [Amphibalanus amphitrite]
MNAADPADRCVCVYVTCVSLGAPLSTEGRVRVCRGDPADCVLCLTGPSSLDRGKSQSVESGGGSGQRPAAGGRQSSAMAAPGTGPGLAQRSLDSVWPPSLSRGSSTASQPEKLDKPPTLVKYAVQERDTLTSIAARFDCLPTELVKANRLNARLVFPGQVLLVPSRVADQPPAATTAAAGELNGAGGEVGPPH